MGLLCRHSARWGAALAASAAAVAVAAPVTDAVSVERLGFGAAPLDDVWPDDTAYGAWYSLHDGFGLTHVEERSGGRVLAMTTRAATEPGETYSTLVRTRRTFGDVDFTVTLTTTAQLRSPVPNPWEVAWVLWRYADNRHFYSFVVKPNGWELGKEDPTYGGSQRFLASTSSATFPIGRAYRVRVKDVGNTITVWLDGARVVRFTDRERPYRSGSIALYAEDSAVRYSPLELRH